MIGRFEVDREGPVGSGGPPGATSPTLAHQAGVGQMGLVGWAEDLGGGAGTFSRQGLRGSLSAPALQAPPSLSSCNSFTFAFASLAFCFRAGEEGSGLKARAGRARGHCQGGGGWGGAAGLRGCHPTLSSGPRVAMGEVGTVVEVSGLTPDVPEELLMLYFENRRSSGGGPVLSWQRLGPGGILSFREPAGEGMDGKGQAGSPAGLPA